MSKKSILAMVLLVLSLALVGCTQTPSSTPSSSTPESSGTPSSTAEIPEFVMAWGSELHTGVMNLTVGRPEAFADNDVHFDIIDPANFDLVKDGEVIAHLQFVLSKGGSEVATMFGQGHLDFGFSSNTAILSAVDAGTKVRILSPMQAEGIALVFPPESELSDWDSFVEHLNNTPDPVRIGYHSPVSAPRIVLEYVLKSEGISVTQDPNDGEADVLLVDLKGASNLLPSLTGQVVDAWVGPAHYPEEAEVQNLGKVVLTLQSFPGEWAGFPCCVFSARQEIIDNYPEVCQALTQIVHDCMVYATDHREELSEVIFERLGISAEAVMNSEIVFSTDPTEKWFSDIGIYYDAMQSMNQFSGAFAEASFADARALFTDFQFIENIAQ